MTKENSSTVDLKELAKTKNLFIITEEQAKAITDIGHELKNSPIILIMSSLIKLEFKEEVAAEDVVVDGEGEAKE